MKFDPDCARDILIAAEERLNDTEDVWIIAKEGPVEGLAAYSGNVARYHIDQCRRNGLIECEKPWISGDLPVVALNPSGHQALDALRRPAALKAWHIAKETGLLNSLPSLLNWALGLLNS